MDNLSNNKKPNRQVARSRHMLEEAFLALLREMPFEKITISNITQRADLTRSTFYAHFETKEDLLGSHLDRILEPFFISIYEHGAILQNQSTAIAFNVNLFRLWKENIEILELPKKSYIEDLVLIKLREWHFKIYTDILAPRIPSLNPVLAAYFIDFLASTTFSLLKHWTDEKMPQSPEVMGAILYELTSPFTLQRIVDKFGSSF